MKSLLVRLMAVLFMFAWLPGARAAYVVELTGLTQLGPQVFVAFDLVDGGGTSNVVTLSPLDSDGTLSLLGLSGGATGSPATGLRLEDDNFFNEALLALDGADRLRLRFDFTAVATVPGNFPDSFAVFLLGPATLWPALGTPIPLAPARSSAWTSTAPRRAAFRCSRSRKVRGRNGASAS
jgi:hypothetical protein